MLSWNVTAPSPGFLYRWGTGHYRFSVAGPPRQGFTNTSAIKRPDRDLPAAGARQPRQTREVVMAKYKIAWLPGDGIGIEVLEAATIVLDKLALDAEYIHGDIGWEFWRAEGDAFPDRTVDLLKRVDAALFGAITSKPAKAAEAELVPDLRGKGHLYRSPIVRMRQLFDLYICLRPIKAYPGNPLNFKEGLDLVVFRENTEDLYSGVEFSPVPRELADTLGRLSKAFAPFAKLNTDEYAVSCKINTKRGSERIIRAAFDFAKKFGRKKVTVVHKANVVRATDGLFLEIARDVAKGYPAVALDDANIDAMTMWLLKNPFNYDVLVAPNLYGDIISDLCAQMVGGLGFGCSGNIGDKLAVFEPTHGSAPKHAGLYKANPIATILAVKMMLDWLGEAEKSRALEQATAGVIKDGQVRTYDMGGKNSTLEMAHAIAARL
jgi:3-isopropylmalate dehydrogenase